MIDLGTSSGTNFFWGDQLCNNSLPFPVSIAFHNSNIFCISILGDFKMSIQTMFTSDVHCIKVQIPMVINLTAPLDPVTSFCWVYLGFFVFCCLLASHLHVHCGAWDLPADGLLLQIEMNTILSVQKDLSLKWHCIKKRSMCL